MAPSAEKTRCGHGRFSKFTGGTHGEFVAKVTTEIRGPRPFQIRNPIRNQPRTVARGTEDQLDAPLAEQSKRDS